MQPIMRAAIAAAVLMTAGSVQAAGGSFVCERSPTMEVREMATGSSAFQSIVNEYRARWDAAEARRQCEAYASGQPYQISCLNGRRDWPAILASIPSEYFGRSNKSLASTYDAEMRKGNGFKEARPTAAV